MVSVCVLMPSLSCVHPAWDGMKTNAGVTSVQHHVVQTRFWPQTVNVLAMMFSSTELIQPLLNLSPNIHMENYYGLFNITIADVCFHTFPYWCALFSCFNTMDCGTVMNAQCSTVLLHSHWHNVSIRWIVVQLWMHSAVLIMSVRYNQCNGNICGAYINQLKQLHVNFHCYTLL